MRQRIALTLLMFVVCGTITKRVDQILNEPKWRIDSFRDYKAEDLQVHQDGVTFRYKGHIHKYTGEIRTWDQPEVRVLKIADDNHGSFKWQILVPVE